MSVPRFRLVQGKAIGERSTPTIPNGISTPEPNPLTPQHVVKQEPCDVSMDGYPMESNQMMMEPHQVKTEINMDSTLSPPQMIGTPQTSGPPQHPMQNQRPMMSFQTPPPSTQMPDSGMPGVTTDDKNVTKCVRFLKTLINLSNNEDPDQPDKAAKVKTLIQGVVYLETTAEEFTRNLQQVLKSQAQPHLLPFLQNTIPALRAAVRNGEAAVEGVDPPPGYVFNNGRAHPNMSAQQHMAPMPIVQPPQQIINRLNAEPQMQRPPPPMMRPPQMGQRPPMMGMAPGGQFPMNQQNPNQMRMQGHEMPPPQQMPTQPQTQNQNAPPSSDMDDSPRKRADGSLKSLILSSDEVLQRITRRIQLSCSVEEEALVAISDAVESNLREIITYMAGIAEHRVESMRVPENYVAIDDVKRQLRFLEDLDRQEEELRESREKESLIRMSKNKNSGKETIEKAKEMQRQDAEAKRNRDANAAAIAALSSNRTVKNKWEGSAPAASAPRPRTVRVTTRDLHLMVNTDNRFKGTFIREKLSYGGPATDTTI